jgi:hypothetical protein
VLCKGNLEGAPLLWTLEVMYKKAMLTGVFLQGPLLGNLGGGGRSYRRLPEMDETDVSLRRVLLGDLG